MANTRTSLNPAALTQAKLLHHFARDDEVGTQLQRPPEIGDRALPVAQTHFGLAAIIPGERVGRIVLERLVVVGNPALAVTLVEADQATVAPAARIRRCEGDDLGIVAGGA